MKKLIKSVLTNFVQEFMEKYSKLYETLLDDGMHSFENQMKQLSTDLSNQLSLVLISKAAESPELEQKVKTIAQKKGLGRVRKSKVKLQLRTGYIIDICSWFAERSKSKRRCKKRKRGPNNSGEHLILSYWGCIDKTTPCYYSYAAQLCILCPSFEIASQVLQEQGIAAGYKRIRRLAYRVVGKAVPNRVKAILKPGENLKGKKVLISVDGGRTRTRIHKEKNEHNKRKPYDTPWREPKLFVIHVINKDGSMSKTELPLYDACIGHAGHCFKLLADYLEALHIKKAEEVLFIADGASWIWERAQKMLLSLGVAANRIIEAIDYYHACQHLNEVITKLVHLPAKKSKALFQRLKNDLWHGKIESICDEISTLANHRPYVVRGLAYFQKAVHRFQYADLRRKNLPCGSGIVESAIRRVINLRFKSPSTFWKQANVNGLIFLRAAFLAGRWPTLIQNLILITQFSKNKIIRT